MTHSHPPASAPPPGTRVGDQPGDAEGAYTHRPYYWELYTEGSGTWRRRNTSPPGQDLAALRRGMGRPPGSVPAMWQHYVHLGDGPTGSAAGDAPESSARGWARLVAEHHALTLFGMHQQSQTRPMHHTGFGLGNAVRALADSGRFSTEAVRRRFTAAATAGGVEELAHHLRGLISQLRSVDPPLALDYTRLVQDLTSWQFPDGQALVRRSWGRQYESRRSAPAEPSGQR